MSSPRPDEPLGRATVITHKIDTGDAAPVKQHLCRQPLAGNDYVDKTVAEICEEGISQPSKSP